MDTYQKLLKKFREPFILNSAQAILYWDLETYIPPRGVPQRGEQLALMSQLAHRMITSRELRDLLEQAEKQGETETFDAVQMRNLYLIRKEIEEATVLPEELVAKIAKQQAITIDLWKKAKAAQDWKMFEPEFKTMLDLTKQKARLLMDVKDVNNSYDALLDNFEPGITADHTSQVFSNLRTKLIPLIDSYVEASSSVNIQFLQQPIPIDVQRKIATDLCTVIGYDVTSDQAPGRIDETEHPFTVGLYNDVRITVNYFEDNVASAIFAILHEAGHAMYELGMGLNQEWHYQPVSQATSFGIHESQSRFIENIMGRSHEFWQFYFPRLNELSNNAFTTVGLNEFVQAVNQVQRSKIRIEADEVTYSLHVIIRFEIERDLFADKIDVAELPGIWNEKYDEYFKIKIDNDSEGVMQDTHWAGGSYGYFPSYAWGNIYGGQLVKAMDKDIPDWKTQLATGNVQSITQWSIDNIHAPAGLFDPVELLQQVTGTSPSAEPFIEYLKAKYSRLFNI